MSTECIYSPSIAGTDRLSPLVMDDFLRYCEAALWSFHVSCPASSCWSSQYWVDGGDMPRHTLGDTAGSRLQLVTVFLTTAMNDYSPPPPPPKLINEYSLPPISTLASPSTGIPN